MKIGNSRQILALGLLSVLPLSAAAQQAPAPGDSLPAYLLEGVVVTSRRAPLARQDAPQTIEVVTRSDLDRTPANDVAEALRRNEAVDVVQYPGLLAGVAVRGFRPQFSGINPRTLILVDGRPAGVTNLALLDLAGVQRIEVLKGPASALYGSSAMGGVVNVITRRSTGQLSGRVDGRYGSFGAYRGELTAGGSLLAALDFDLSLASYGQSGGYDIGRNRLVGTDSITKTLRNGTTVRLAELSVDTALTFSDFAQRSGSLRLGYALGERWRIDARGGVTSADDVQNPGDLAAPYDSRSLKDLERRTGDVALTGALGAHSLTLRAYGAREDGSYYNSVADSRFVSFRTPTRWHGAQLQDAVTLGAHSLTAGLDVNTTEASSEAFRSAGQRSAPFSPNSAIHSAAAFAEARLGLLDGRLVGTAGGRLDRVRFAVRETELLPNYRPNEETHTVFNPSAGLLFQAGAGVRLHASAGRGFVTPDAFNVAGYAELPAGQGAVRITQGNPELDPESSTSWDAGVRIFRPRQGLEADLTYFHTDVTDRITAQPRAPAPGQRTAGGTLVQGITTYANADEARIRGVEGSASYDLGAAGGYARSLRLFVNATRLLTAEESLAGVTSDIKNVADLTTVFGVDYDDLRRLTARFSGRYVGERSDADWSDFMNPGDVRYPAYLVFDLATSVRVAERYRVGLLLGNLTDENYYEVRGYNLPGRSVQLQVGVDF